MDRRYHILDVVPIRVSTLYLKISPDAEIHSCKKKNQAFIFLNKKSVCYLCINARKSHSYFMNVFYVRHLIYRKRHTTNAFGLKPHVAW